MTMVVLQGDADRMLVASMWMAGSWLILAPFLIVVWEYSRADAMYAFLDRAQENWPTVDIIKRSKFADSTALRIVVWGGFGVAMMTAYAVGLEDIYGLWGEVPRWTSWTVLGLLSVGWLGVTFGVGTWGVVTTLVTAFTALKVGKPDGHTGSDIRWDPFEPRQAEGLERTTSWAYTTGFVFSCGAVFLPALYLALGALPLPAQIVGLAIAVALTVGGLCSFLLPSIWVARVARRQVEKELRKFKDPLDRMVELALRPWETADTDAWNRIAAKTQTLLDLRGAIASERSSPAPIWWATRISVVLLIPVVINLLQARLLG